MLQVVVIFINCTESVQSISRRDFPETIYKGITPLKKSKAQKFFVSSA